MLQRASNQLPSWFVRLFLVIILLYVMAGVLPNKTKEPPQQGPRPPPPPNTPPPTTQKLKDHSPTKRSDARDHAHNNPIHKDKAGHATYATTMRPQPPQTADRRSKSRTPTGATTKHEEPLPSVIPFLALFRHFQLRPWPIKIVLSRLYHKRKRGTTPKAHWWGIIFNATRAIIPQKAADATRDFKKMVANRHRNTTMLGEQSAVVEYGG